jgi:hypothetical protein
MRRKEKERKKELHEMRIESRIVSRQAGTFQSKFSSSGVGVSILTTTSLRGNFLGYKQDQPLVLPPMSYFFKSSPGGDEGEISHKKL